jgi:K+-transporting ATPase ATPase C chain
MRFSEHIRPALLAVVVFTVVTGLVYPLLVTAISAAVFPKRAAGSLIVLDGKVVGSELIGQTFAAPGRFWGRPSATGPVAYNGGASSGSNLGNANPALLQAVKDRATALRSAHPEAKGPVPLDLLTASASGLDPHIRPQAAYYQVERVARERGLDAATVRELVTRHVEGRTWGFWGEPRVNVLRLNLALDRLGS